MEPHTRHARARHRPGRPARAPRVRREEFVWREWFLGEGRYAGQARDPSKRASTGAPARIPKAWWRRLEAFLTHRNDSAEPTTKPPLRRRVRARLPKFPRKLAGGDVQLSEHFRVREFDCKDGTRVPKAAIPALVRLCRDVLEPMRDRFGPCTVMSGYRHAAYNRRIGGARYSQHIYDLDPSTVAADLIFARGQASEWAAYAESLLARKYGGRGGVGRYTGFVHVDNRGYPARWRG